MSVLLLIGIVPVCLGDVLNVGGKSFAQFGAHFLIGYFVKVEFSLYFFHQTIIIVVGYFIMPHIDSVYLEYVLIIAISFPLSYLMYLICRRFRVTRFLFAIK